MEVDPPRLPVQLQSNETTFALVEVLVPASEWSTDVGPVRDIFVGNSKASTDRPVFAASSKWSVRGSNP